MRVLVRTGPKAVDACRQDFGGGLAGGGDPSS
jgi:hypothetical protein